MPDEPPSYEETMHMKRNEAKIGGSFEFSHSSSQSPGQQHSAVGLDNSISSQSAPSYAQSEQRPTMQVEHQFSGEVSPQPRYVHRGHPRGGKKSFPGNRTLTYSGQRP